VTASLLVAVDAPLAVGDVALTYAAPAELLPGTAVLVPLRTRLSVGYVLQSVAPGPYSLRPIVAVLSDIPALPPDLLALARWMAGVYLCSIGEAVGAMLPPGLMRDVRLTASLRANFSLPRRAQALQERGAAVSSLHRTLGPGGVVRLTQWVSEGAVQLRAALPPAPSRPSAPTRRFLLRVHPALWTPPADGRREVLLLAGEREGTYLAAVADTLGRDRRALAMFASVAAAERFARRARDVLGAAVVVQHGDLPVAERLARWLAIRAGQAALVVGTRAAVFAPLPGVGLLIVDEENDVGHREERVPRYHVPAVARYRARQAGAVLLLADDVLSAETYAAARDPGVELRRAPGALPRVAVVDLRRREEMPRAEVLTPPLVAALQRTLARGGRALLFVHRKGYAAVLLCADCGAPLLCPRCDVPLAFDAREQAMHCRYCHDRYPPPSVCPRCGGRVFTPLGAGTQQVARLARGLKLGPVARLDSDVAPTRAAAGAIVRQFRVVGGILVATALVLEAGDFPTVDLAAVVLADASLRHPDYRATERGLRTLWRVRALARQWCVLQTYTPDHPAILALRRGDLRPFYRAELRIRRDFHYPPFGEVLSVEVAGPEERAKKAAAALAAVAGAGTEALGPARLRRGRGSRWQVVFRTAGSVPRDPLAAWLRRPPPGVRAAVDVDP
jgi:primosomal protein N' (replication factor Y)